MSTAQITVVGLGSGDPDQLTLGIWRKLQAATQLYIRTKDHPMMKLLESEGIAYRSFDDIYEQYDSFPEVYDAIAGELLAAASDKEMASVDIVYAVPGHPMVAERTVQLLRERCADQAINLHIMGGESFLDQAFVRLGIDPIEGFALLDAAELPVALLQPQLHTIIGQVYDAYTASDVKLALMERYPDDYEILVCHALGVSGQEKIIQVPLYEIDRLDGYGNLSLIYVPRSDDSALRNRTFERLHEIIAILRSPEGCPWDREQTHQSIRKNFIEELYEALEALDNDDPDSMVEEFGDVILQVMLHSQMEEEQGSFTIFDVIEALNEKLLFRHPHVFGEQQADNADEALVNWEQMKSEEHKRKGTDRKSPLDGIPPHLPALMTAYKLQKKAAKVGFDWSEIDSVLAKIEEELLELREAIASNDKEGQADELGDLLFAVVNASRFIKADPEEALTRTNRKFIARFRYIEEQLSIKGKTFDQTDLLEMDRLWEEAKTK